MTNRAQAPEFEKIKSIVFLKPEMQRLNNGIPVYSLNAGEQDIVQIDILFEAGQWFQKSPLVASSTVTLLNEGTKKYSGNELNEKLDYYGASVKLYSENYFATISLYTLNKYIEQSLELVHELITSPVFPSEEFEIYRNKIKQQYKLDNEKVEIIAKKTFMNSLYGENHPYGVYIRENHFDELHPEDLKEHHNKFYTAERCKIICSGKINDNLFKELNKLFGEKALQDKMEVPQVAPLSSETKKHHIKKENALQTALRIGNLSIDRNHADFFALSLCNTVFGGYFGSRLMSNIREDKGYTYGIYSLLLHLYGSSNLIIASSVGKDVYKKALHEIYFEMDRLKNEKVGTDELELVKNFMLGDLQRSLDGPFEIASVLKHFLMNELNLDFYDNIAEKLHAITSDDILRVAQTYLNKGELFEVCAGV